MKRIVVSQRRDDVPGRNEHRDALDIRIGAILWDLGLLALPLCSEIADVRSYMTALAPDGVLLTGGHDLGVTPQRDQLEVAALDYAADRSLPVFGICRGMHTINLYQGGTASPMDGHVVLCHPVTGPLVSNDRTVNSFHNQVIVNATLGQDLVPVAHAQDGTIEAVQHRTRPWCAIMWHPERDMPVAAEDLALIKAHFRLERNSF